MSDKGDRALNADLDEVGVEAVAMFMPTPHGIHARASARDLLNSTDPAVHAAMLDALTRRGVLQEKRRRVRLNDDGSIAADAYVEFCNAKARRLVTSWEVDP